MNNLDNPIWRIMNAEIEIAFNQMQEEFEDKFLALRIKTDRMFDLHETDRLIRFWRLFHKYGIKK